MSGLMVNALKSIKVNQDIIKELFAKITIEGPQEIIVFGHHRKDIKRCLTHKKILEFVNLNESLLYLKDRQNIVFSPGYPSGKDYINFEERGAHFNFLIKEVLDD